MTSSESFAANPPQWTVVQTDAGTVTLAPLVSLQARVKELTDWATTASSTSTAWHAQAEDRFAAAGSVLVPRRSEWPVPTELQASLDRATALVAEIGEADRSAQDLKQHKSEGSVFHRIDAWRHERRVMKDRATETSELRGLLIQVARGAPASTIAEADVEKEAATELDTRAAQLDQEIDSVRTSMAAISQEIGRREESARSMGFDALLEAALLQTSGASPVASPLLLKAGEAAYLSVPATLARMVTRTHYVGGSSGFSFPIGHTGIRYRVGSFSGHPVQQQALTKLDGGTFVVSNQRIAFIGHTKSTSIPLAKILHVEVYSDAVSVFQQARENPDFYLLSQPKRAVFLLNWVLGGRQQAKQ
jgi:hypothetical protein